MGTTLVTPTASDCRALPGESAWEACRTLSLTGASNASSMSVLLDDGLFF